MQTASYFCSFETATYVQVLTYINPVLNLLPVSCLANDSHALPHSHSFHTWFHLPLFPTSIQKPSVPHQYFALVFLCDKLYFWIDLQQVNFTYPLQSPF